MTGEKHILILSSWYPSKGNPFLGNFVQRQAKLVSTKHKVTVLSVNITNNKSEQIVDTSDGNFREISVPFLATKNTLLRKYRHFKAFQKGLKMITNVTHVHGHIIIPDGLNFVRAKKHFNCPLIVTEHSSLYFFREKLERKKTFVLTKTLKHINQLVAVSEVLKTNLALKAPNHAIKVIPNHIDSSLFQPKKIEHSESFKFLHISTLSSIKNVYEILDAFELAFQQNNSIELAIVSDNEFSEYVSYAKKLSSYAKISFFGPVAWEDTVQFYQNSHCFILNSKVETFSIVLAEAWSCGIPVISTNVGIASNLPSFLGIQTDHSVENLKDAILEMTLKRNEFDTSKIRAHALQFNGEIVLQQLNQLYE